MKTFVAKSAAVERKWHHIDADGVVLGRLAADVARILQGKHKAIYTPGVDTGDFVVITNAEKVKITGKKADHKVYRYHTEWVGGLKEIPYRRMQERHPDRVIELAIRRMMPKTKLGRRMMAKLKIYAGTDHPHSAQAPEGLTV